MSDEYDGDETPRQPRTTPTQQAEKLLLDKLAELGGARIEDDELVREGNRFIIPASMTARDARKFLRDYIQREEQEHRYSRTFRARPWDGAAALERGMRSLFGTVGLPKPTPGSFFSPPVPPELRTIKVGPNETLQIPWGQIQAPMLGDESLIYTSGQYDEEYGLLFHMIVDAPRKYRAVVEGLFKVVQDELDSRSIYRGQAITGQEDPDFLDLATVDPERVVYGETDRIQLEANLWSLLRHTEEHRQEGLSLKRAVVLGGDYGTGKTLTALRTAQIAVENGWGFIMARPGRDDIEQAFATARLLQPCVVFVEDVDNLGSSQASEDHISRVLDLFDGLSSKGTELIAVLTTNHLDKLHKGMFRPGRIDAVIEFQGFDAPAFEKFIALSVGRENLDPLVDWETVATAMEGYRPAWINEAAARAKRYSMVRNDGQVGTIGTDDLVQAADGLRPQLDLMNEASDKREVPTLDASLKRLVDEALNGAVIDAEGKFGIGAIDVTANGKAEHLTA
jgi:transitional endoplasmic reticulum ATPase